VDAWSRRDYPALLAAWLRFVMLETGFARRERTVTIMVEGIAEHLHLRG